MTQATVDSSVQEQIAKTRASIAVGLSLVERVRATAINDLVVEDQFDLLRVRGLVPASAFGPLNEELLAAAAVGHRARAVASNSGSELALSWDTDGRVTPYLSGDAGHLAPQRDLAELNRAIDVDDGLAALSHMGDFELDLEIVIRPPSDGAAWAASSKHLTGPLSDGRWADVLTALASRGAGCQVPVLVQDAGDAYAYAPGIVLAGPDAAIPDTEPARSLGLTDAYRARAGFSSRDALFTPTELVCEPMPECALADIGWALARVARVMTWYWLADSVRVEPHRAVAHFEGVTSIDLELLPYGTGLPTAEVALAEWALATGEPARAEAIQQAVTFAVRTTTDLEGAAAPVLRTARSLYELAGRGLISEALTARRSARDSAFAAARAAASTAREVATKTVERTLALVVAAGLALLANAQKLISDQTSYAIILTLAGLAGLALAIAWFVDTRSGIAVLDAFDSDVELYRDTLSEDDITATRHLSALARAREDLWRARVASCVVYVTFILLAFIGCVWMSSGQGPAGGIPPSVTITPTPTSAPTTFAPSPSATPQVAAASRLRLTRSVTYVAAEHGSSCSQILTLSHPAAVRSLSVSRSLWTLRSSFGFQ